MKSLQIILTILSDALLSSEIHAQKKIGVFIHGFQGNAEKWTAESGVPQAWISGQNSALDDYVALNYETTDLMTATSRANLLSNFINSLQAKGDPVNDQWILIGHSLGGLVARDLYPSLRAYNFNIVAAISVGGPSQGAMATNVDKGQISYRLNLMKQRIEDAYAKKIHFLDLAVDILDLVNNTSNASKIAAIPDYLEIVRDSALGYASHIVEQDVKNLIGPEGSVISRINSYSANNAQLHPPNYLAVIGAEKDKAPVRMAGYIFDVDPSLKDEVKMLEQVDNLRNDYFKLHEDLYDLSFNINYGANLTCRIQHPLDLWNKCQPFEDAFKRDRRYRELWKTAGNEIDQIGNIWSTFINAYRIKEISYQEFIPPCPDEDDPFPIMYDVLANIEIIEQDCSNSPNGEYRTKYMQMLVSDKHDGVVTTYSGLWHDDDSFGDLNNRLFDDVPADGGYNHFELRNHKRAYTLPGQFNEGDVNPSMLFARNWLNDLNL
ncbi:MAG: GPI inositol-deacylase [Gracilimonas sp.]|uniref:esterase/lipase family protein n=1 Tax=Gracilimonas sp. TaxID=1974203 RepID=UPI0037517387|nr:GPI inositol-deacylase [Gracilimonas sp.]